MKWTCPYCEQPIEGAPEKCPVCNQSLLPPTFGQYLRPARLVRELLERVQRGDVGESDRLPATYNRIVGVLQQTLDTARDDMEASLRRSRLRSAHRGGRRDPLEVLHDFEAIQTQLTQATVTLGEAFQNPESLAESAPTLTYVAAIYQDMAERLEALVLQTGSSHGVRAPLGAGYASGLEAMSGALTALVAFSESGDKQALERCLQSIDQACQHLEAHQAQLQAEEEAPHG